MAGWNFDLCTREAEQKRIEELETQVVRLRVGLSVLLESEGGLAAYLNKIAEMGRVARGESKTLVPKVAQRLQDIETALWPIYDAHDLKVSDGAHSSSERSTHSR